MDLRPRASNLAAVLDLLDEVTDVVRGRVDSPEPPEWCTRRGWDAFLIATDDEALRRAEHEGLAAVLPALASAPQDLAALGERVRALRTRAEGDDPAECAVPLALRAASEQKRAQVAALVALARSRFSGIERVVEVGAGHGHAARALSTELSVPAIGYDRDAARVERAAELDDGPPAAPRFAARELTAGQLRFERGDLVVGLHACGSLGDIAVRAAARDGASCLLVSCCLQKIDAPVRAAVSGLAEARGMALSREILGLSNVSARAHGVETDMDAIMAARETRHALRLLLEARGLSTAPGEESRGINRRRMSRGLADVAARALAARGQPAPSDAEIASARDQARDEYARVRRLDLPRAMLARLVELAVVLDRATVLEEAGHDVEVVRAFAVEVSPRNLAILARPRA